MPNGVGPSKMKKYAKNRLPTGGHDLVDFLRVLLCTVYQVQSVGDAGTRIHK